MTTPLVSTFFGTCRERHLRTADVNVPDENYLFLVTSRLPELGSTIWPSFDQTTQMNPLAGFRTYSSTYAPTRAIFAGGLQSDRFGYGFIHPVTVPSGELYLRVQIGIPRAPISGTLWWAYTESPIVTIIDNIDKSVKLALSWLWNGDTNAATRDRSRVISLRFVDRDGISRTLMAEYVFPLGSEYMNIDIKVFLPKDGPAQMVAAPIDSLGASIVDKSLVNGRGYYDTQTDQTLTVNSFDGINPTNCITRFFRVGVGNKITTARP